MEEKKKLRKLILRKETIVNLNDYEMNVTKGGTTPTMTTVSSVQCSVAVVASVTAVSALTIAGYNVGKDESLWNCPPSKEQNCMSAVSENWMWQGGQRYCMIGEVVVYGMA